MSCQTKLAVAQRFRIWKTWRAIQLATWTLLGMLHPYLYPPDADDGEVSDEAIEQMVTIYLDGAAMPEG